ncbi:hypothetical protein RchiOBHm_Chr7g0226701 [Rosa chinensis]|uniref:Uncharacterized protein n=1 Tax=Rosa chinensis TaxID=74649 RepID=A0A2P6PEF4_ROSCH|nr:hypothetical protein RchiOBHm_Chr7g0226701 [Rosa chinensis]
MLARPFFSQKLNFSVPTSLSHTNSHFGLYVSSDLSLPFASLPRRTKSELRFSSSEQTNLFLTDRARYVRPWST